MDVDGIYIRRIMFDHEVFCQPTGDDVECVSWNRGCDWTEQGYFGVVKALMLAGFCLVCSVSFGEDIFKPTGRYEVAKSTSEPVRQSPRLSRYLVKFTSDTCGPCKSWEAKERPQLDAVGVAITVVDCTHGNTWGVTRVPEFWIVDKSPRKVVQKFTGYTTAEVLYDSLSEPVSSCELLGKAEQLPADMSHSEMVALHNQLHGGGSWTWPGDLATHLRTAHGVSTSQPTQSQPVRVQQSANCPGGNCPTNRVQRRRGGILSGLFR
jgi:hypothetical protein